MILDLNPLTDGRSNSFIESASWPDDIKAPGMYFWNKWHFIDKVLNPNGLEDSAVMEDFNTNIIFALQNVNETLINQKKATLEKSIMAR